MWHHFTLPHPSYSAQLSALSPYHLAIRFCAYLFPSWKLQNDSRQSHPPTSHPMNGWCLRNCYVYQLSSRKQRTSFYWTSIHFFVVGGGIIRTNVPPPPLPSNPCVEEGLTEPGTCMNGRYIIGGLQSCAPTSPSRIGRYDLIGCS